MASKQSSNSAQDAAQRQISLLNTQKQIQDKLGVSMREVTQKEAEQQKQRTELNKIKVNAEHVKYLVDQFDLAKPDAELALRENNNDFEAVVKKLINSV